MNPREGAQIPKREQLAILLQHQRKKNGNAQQSVRELGNEYGVSRNVPARIYKNATERGTIKPKRRSGRPSLVKSADRQANMVNAIRNKRTASSRNLGMQLGMSHTTANKMRRHVKFYPQYRVSRPPLPEQHVQRRLQWCQENPTIQPRTAFLDEKW